MDTFHEKRHEKKLIKSESLDILKSAINCVPVKVLGVSTVLQLYVLKKNYLVSSGVKTKSFATRCSQLVKR